MPDSTAPRDLRETTLATEKLVEGELLTVWRDMVRTPDGSESVREYVHHPGASAVVPLFENGDTLLVRQFRYPPRRVFLEVPAGKFDDAEERAEALAARELEEETGYRAETFTPLGAFYPTIGYSDEVIHLFLARGITKGQQQLDEGEALELIRLPFAEAARRAASGELFDMKTVVALLRAKAVLDAEKETE